MTFARSATIGGLVSLAGIVIGNAAIWKIMDAYQEVTNSQNQLFSTVAVPNPGNIRTTAGKWYREAYPDGPLIKRLRLGQALTITGFLVTFLLLAI